MEQIGEYASRSSTVFLKSQSDPLLHKLEDAVHRIMVRRSAPDWLPLVPGASYWVPPPRSQTHGIAKLVEKLANPISDEESISISSVRGWPSSDYFIKGVQPQSMETEMASNTASHSEDEEGYLIWSFDVVIFKVSLGNFSLETSRFHMMFQNMIQDLDFLFHMFFLARYCKLLEENSFRGKTADFLYMLLFGATVLTGIVLFGGMIPYLSVSFSKIIFLSNSLTFMMVYVWSKQNPYIHMSFLGLFTFTAAYLPWVLLGFSILVGASAWGDFLGMIAGHAYYFLAFVYPRMTARHPLKTPSFLKALFADEPVVIARPEDVRFAHVPFDEIHQD